MKRLTLFIACILSLHAAGNIQQNFQQLGTSNNFVLSANWTGDPVTGVVSPVQAQFTQAVQGFRIFAVEVAPGTPAPTNNYTITLTTPAGVDMLAGVGASLSNTAASSLQTPSFAPPVNGTVTINITGNSVGGAKGSLLIYFAPISQISGLIPNGPGFPTNNTFTGTNAFTGPVTTGNFNNIRIVDGVKFAQTAAGINAADADLGVGVVGEIWVPTPSAGGNFLAIDAQISISAGHTLRIFRNLIIDAAGKGPILLGGSAKLFCNPSPNNTPSIIQTSAGSITSMVRLTVQDGSQVNNAIEGCNISANGSTVTNGVIDATGMTGHAWVRDTITQGFTSAWGIFIQDIQSGALGGTNNVQMMNNQINASGTGGCIEIIHSSTNVPSTTLQQIDIFSTNCNVGASNTAGAVLIQNTSAGASNLRHIDILSLQMGAISSGQSGLILNGVEHASVRNVACTGGSSLNCVSITNSANNVAQIFDNIFQFSGNNALNDATTGTVINTSSLQHYELSIAGAASYYPAVAYLRVNGLTPASATGTGFGTGPTFAVNPGSTNNAGIIVVTAGTTPGISGTVTLNFNTAQTNFGVNPPVCVWLLGNSTGSWNARATILQTALSTTSATGQWDNNSVNLTGGSLYNFNYWCAAK